MTPDAIDIAGETGVEEEPAAGHAALAAGVDDAAWPGAESAGLSVADVVDDEVMSWAGSVAAAWLSITAVIDDKVPVCVLGETLPCVIDGPGDGA